MHHEIVRCNVAANSLQFATPDKEIRPRLIAPREKYIRRNFSKNEEFLSNSLD